MRGVLLAVGLLAVVCGVSGPAGGTTQDPADPAKKGEAPAGDPLVKRQPVDDKYPLPQDMEKAKKLRADATAAARAATVEVFDKGPGAKAAWAGAARKAMEAYARRAARAQIGQRGVEFQDFLAAVQAATDAGADDPLIRYWQARFVARAGPAGWWDLLPPAETAAAARGVLDRLPKTPYPVTLRVHMAWNSFVDLKWADGKQPGVARPGEVAAAEKTFWKLYAELAARNDRPAQKEVYDLARLAAGINDDGKDGRAAGWREVDRVLRDAKAAEWVRLAVEGRYLIHAAWDARGTGTADTVTPEGWGLFKERLEAAKDRLGRAWKAEPTFAPAADLMVTVATGLGFPRDEMETWFRRAMEADPDCRTACVAKAEYLSDQWHGAGRDQYDFRLQCYRTGNWYAHLPFFLDGSYGMNGGESAPTDPKQAKYFSGDWVQADLWAVYDTYLRANPDDRWARTRYAAVLVAGGRTDEAARHFKALGDRPWAPVFPDRKTYEEYRAKAAGPPPKKGDR